ncbi:MAG TPA: hypothetical protein VGU20_30690 [Stellaceae bacterium]|nr:hypothetical protein [Stellaceae bacterium]
MLDEYFRWKYTAPDRYATTTAVLKRFVDENGLGHLDQLRSRLLTLDTTDVRSALKVACEIPGLGTAGSSDLLALMYPRDFGTVDQFVVNALRQVDGLPEAQAITRMNPGGLTIRDGVILIDILHRKAADNNRVFKSSEWTPRRWIRCFGLVVDSPGLARRPIGCGALRCAASVTARYAHLLRRLALS